VSPSGSPIAMQPPARPRDTGPPRRRYAVKRIALLSLITVCALNMLGGAPLLALWVGSQIVGVSGQLTVPAVAGIAATLLGAEAILMRIIDALDQAYGRLIDRPTATRRRAAWLRSMRDSGPHAADRDRHVTATEAVLILAVITAAIGFEIWFFLFARVTFPQT
jgi:hypothetical protein